MNRQTLLVALTAAAPMLFIPSCLSKTTGNEGNLTFSYVADEAFRDFNKPIAVGARLDIKVETAGNPSRPATVLSAGSDDPAVLDVAETAGNTITVEGKADGNILLTVSADGGLKGTLEDSVNLTVRTPEVVKLSHTCTGEGNASYLTGQEIWIPYELEMSNGQPVIGYGYYPVSADPESSLSTTGTGKETQFLKFNTTASRTTAVTLSSDIDDAQLLLDILDEGDILGATLVTDYPAFVDNRTLYYVLPTAGGGDTPVCQARADFTVQSDTPDVCEVEVASPADTSLTSAVNEYGWVAITGSQVGVCEFTVTYPLGDSGNGATEQLSADIIAVDTP